MIGTFAILRSWCRQKAYSSIRTYSEHQNPFAKTWNVISKDIPVLFSQNNKTAKYPTHADIVIIGGGFIGASVAYWLKTRAGDGLSVVVLEKDLCYKQVQDSVTLGTIIQHYSLPENMQLSLFGADFLRNAKQNLGAGVDIQFCPHGHLVLASKEYAEKLEENFTLQRENGIRNELLTLNDLEKRYPWINTTDVHLGCIGTESEGSFNAWELLQGFVTKSQDMGAIYLNAEVTGFELEEQRDVLMEGIAPGSYKRINKVLYKTADGGEHAIKFAISVLSAGHESGNIAKLAQIGTGDGLLKVPLTIKGRDSKVYSIENSTKTTGLHTPLITDTSGLWIRRNGLNSNLLCGHVPFITDIKDPLGEEYLNKIIIPSLINRVPNWKNSKVVGLITELFDYNTFDDTGILGPHPYHNNLFIASGFGKQGCAHAAGLGRALAELIVDSHFTTIDLTRLTFDRILTDKPMVEFNIY